MHQIKWVSPHALKPNPRNARTHSKKQIRQIADSVLAFGFVVPIVVDENNTILLGHGRLAAAIDLDLNEVPVIVLEGLSEAKKRALLLADNKITENAGWDRKRLYIELPELAELPARALRDITQSGRARRRVLQRRAPHSQPLWVILRQWRIQLLRAMASISRAKLVIRLFRPNV